MEFQDAGKRLLPPERKRLADLDVLDAASTSSMSDAGVATVVQWCHDYFAREPYRLWFDKLNTLVNAACADFYDGTACHLDLIQWATDPVWGGFSPDDTTVRERLLADDAPFLREQLRADNLELVLLNGSQVIDQVQRLGIVSLRDCGPTPVGKQGKTSRRLQGVSDDGTRYLGWSLNASHSQTTDSNRAELAHWIASVTG